MALEGTVTNVAAFGAFVDIGVHQDGLVHISQLADRFVKDPHEVVRAGDVVRVRVTEIDIPRKRIGLSMRKQATGDPGEKPTRRREPSPPKSTDRSIKPPRSPGRSDDTGALGAALRDALKKR